MLNKFGLVLAIAVLGCALFAIGFLLAESDTSLSQEVNTSTAPTLLEANNDSDANDSNSSTKADDADTLPKIHELTLRVIAPDDQRYTLMLGQYGTTHSAERQSSRLRQLGIDTNITEVADQAQRRWWLLTTGDFSLTEANRAMYDLKARLDVDAITIRLPATPDEKDS